MFTAHIFRVAKALGFVGSIVVLAVFSCLAWPQKAVQGTVAKSLAASSAGRVNSLSGSVFIQRGSGVQIPARSGDLIDRGAIVSTGASGEAVLLFADGQHLTLSAQSVLRVDEYQFDARDIKASRVSFTLAAGMMRIVTGAINAANPDALKISAGDALIGVRSKDTTSFVVEADTKFARETGSAAVIVGEISIRRPDGTTTKVETDQFTRWQPSVAPELPQPLGAAPARLQAMAAIGEAPLARESSQAPAAATGIVNSVSGVVLIRTGDGGEISAKPGDLIDKGTIVITGASGEAVLLFPDGQHLTLSADSVLRVDEYQFDARDIKASRVSFGLAAGMMTIVTGAINAVNPDALKISAGDALIGVRSKDATSFVVEAETKFARETGSVAVIVGEVSILRPDGSTTKVDTGQFTRWQPSVAAELPKALATAPERLKAAAVASRPAGLEDDVPLDVEAAVKLALATLPAPAAGPDVPAQAQLEPGAAAAGILPPVTPGAAGGCVGSSC